MKQKHNIKTVILAGGLGTRLSEKTYDRPKPMVEIGGKPILWHIMNITQVATKIANEREKAIKST